MKRGLLNMASALQIVAILGLMAICAGGQEGLISIDCGLMNSSNSTNEVGLLFVPDEKYIDIGVNQQVSSAFLTNVSTIYNTLRSFPVYDRNCYNLTPVVKGKRYLVRASFLYGDYDGKNTSPTFDLYVGVDFMYNIKLDNSSHVLSVEITTEAISSSIDVCLVKTTTDGIPFISSLELRRLNDSIFSFANRYLSLVTTMRVSTGFKSLIRYPNDHNDRIWAPGGTSDGSSIITTTLSVAENTTYWFDLPVKVLQNAVTSDSGIQINWAAQPDSTFHIYLHFVELIKLPQNETRTIVIHKNGAYFFGPFSPSYLKSKVVYSTRVQGASHYSFLIYSATKSANGPILNGFQIYEERRLTGFGTSTEDASVLRAIKETYGIRKNWNADPCLPQKYEWVGVTCNNYSETPRIISLDLSSSGLNGTISTYFAELTAIQSLNLSGNQLEGSIPPFLADLPNLTSLDLSSNQLSGTIPSGLMQKVKDHLLTLRVGNNTQLCTSESCNRKQNRNRIIAIAKILIPCTVFLLIAIVIFIIIIKFKVGRKQGKANARSRLESEDCIRQTFTYKDIVVMTNNFEKTIGKGGSGVVYYGIMISTRHEVAVKVLNGSLPRGINEFLLEVKLLMRIHHKCLISLIGYCEEGANLILLYEYMPNGNLRDRLADTKLTDLTWTKRLEIAISAATALDYLHSGCTPPIIHRDVKTTNILLNEKMEAKLSDFGLSKSCIGDDQTTAGVSTVIAGTPGYIDPEYNNTNKLTKKSDVYSFGVVLFELISGLPAIFRSTDGEPTHIVKWATMKLSEGSVQSLVDPRLMNYENGSLSCVANMAMRCTSQEANKRPRMANVLHQLKEAMGIESGGDQVSASSSTEKPLVSASSLNSCSITEIQAR